MHNKLEDCLSGCGVAYGGATAPTCANARGKVYNCLDFSGDLPCDDTKALDRCENGCTLAASCTEIMGDPLNPVVSQYTMCMNACESNNGGPAATFTVAAGGYVTAGTWKGYAWTGTDGTSSTTITPVDFSLVAAGGPLCVSGTVAGTADYSAVAILGINVNQPMADATTPMPFAAEWDPINNNTNGLAYDITNTGGSPLRIQVQAKGGDTDQRLRWCAPVSRQDRRAHLGHVQQRLLGPDRPELQRPRLARLGDGDRPRRADRGAVQLLRELAGAVLTPGRSRPPHRSGGGKVGEGGAGKGRLAIARDPFRSQVRRRCVDDPLLQLRAESSPESMAE